jgi:hypothetical protein
MSSIGSTYGRADSGTVSVLFTSDTSTCVDNERWTRPPEARTRMRPMNLDESVGLDMLERAQM